MMRFVFAEIILKKALRTRHYIISFQPKLWKYSHRKYFVELQRCSIECFKKSSNCRKRKIAKNLIFDILVQKSNINLSVQLEKFEYQDSSCSIICNMWQKVCYHQHVFWLLLKSFSRPSVLFIISSRSLKS